MKKVINIPYEVQSNEFDLGEIIIHGKRVFSYVSKRINFPGTFTLYNWHELCSITKVYFLKEPDIKESIIGIGLIGDILLIQIYEKSYLRYIQVSTPCHKWLLEKYKDSLIIERENTQNAG